MTRYKLILEYLGTNLIGFQRNDGGDSVQSLVEDAIQKFCGETAIVTACGRTDAGVHAMNMPTHIDLESGHPAETVKRALNFYLSDSNISVKSCETVPNDWHARFDCQARHYRYLIDNSDYMPKITRDRAWWIPRPLNIKKMHAAAGDLIGSHDFTSFRAAECQAASPIKTLDVADIRIDDNMIIIDFSAKSFLHHQVRNMVGTLVEIGLNKPLNVRDIFAAQDRSAAGPTAPAHGLYFVSADY